MALKQRPLTDLIEEQELYARLAYRARQELTAVRIGPSMRISSKSLTNLIKTKLPVGGDLCDCH